MMRCDAHKPYEGSALPNFIMDCRVKPGNDSGEGIPQTKTPGHEARALHCVLSLSA
jgi:hypothetical protein